MADPLAQKRLASSTLPAPEFAETGSGGGGAGGAGAGGAQALEVFEGMGPIAEGVQQSAIQGAQQQAPQMTMHPDFATTELPPAQTEYIPPVYPPVESAPGPPPVDRSRQQQAPPTIRRGIGRPRAPEIPEELRELQGEIGGRFQPRTMEEHLGELENLRLQGVITDEQYDKEAAFWQSPLGLHQRGQEIIQRQEESALARQEQEAALTGAMHDQLSKIEAHRNAAEMAQAEQAEARHRAFQEGVAEHKERTAAADKKIEDYRIRDRRHPFQTALHVVAGAMGGVASAMTGAPNDALRVIEKQIDRDYNAQLEELNSLRTAGKEARNDLAAYYSEYGNMEQARAAFEARRLREYSSAAQRVMRHTQSERARNTADFISKQGGMLAEQKQLKAETMAVQQKMMDEERARAAAAAAAAQRRRAALMAAMSGPEGTWEALSKDDMVVPGFGVASKATMSEKEAQELRSQGAYMSGILRDGQRLMQLLQDKSNLASPTARKEMKRLFANTTVPKVKEIAGASMTDSEKESVHRMFGTEDPTKILSTDQLADLPKVYQNYLNSVKEQTQDKMTARGVRAADLQAARDPFAKDPTKARVKVFKRERGLGQIQRGGGPQQVIKQGAAR